MKYLLLSVLFLVVGCIKEPTDLVKEKYPGKQPGYQTCHNLWNLNYRFNVSKCEKDLSSPKFKRGQKVKFSKKSEYDSKCYGLIIAAYDWATGGENKDQAIYSYKVYCSGKAYHNQHCENGGSLNCPDAVESFFVKF